jgi:hypothetical protein
MMHETRRWCVSTVATPEDLARMLTERTHTLCAGFRVEGFPPYLFLNDATHEDGAGEFACVKILGPSQWLQIESITFSWVSTGQALELIQAALRGDYDGHDFARAVTVRQDTPERHRCRHCA